MPLVDPKRIQGFGSDGTGNGGAAAEKVWHCPAGHLLQPQKGAYGQCSGCSRLITLGDPVMDCRQCDWRLCKVCHPQSVPAGKEDWAWGIFSNLVETAQQEMSDIATDFREMASEFENFVTEIADQTSCRGENPSSLTQAEVDFDSPHMAAERYHTFQESVPSNQSPTDPTESETLKPTAPEADDAKPSAPPESLMDLIDVGQDDLLCSAPAVVAACAGPSTATTAEASPADSVDLLDWGLESSPMGSSGAGGVVSAQAAAETAAPSPVAQLPLGVAAAAVSAAPPLLPPDSAVAWAPQAEPAAAVGSNPLLLPAAAGESQQQPLPAVGAGAGCASCGAPPAFPACSAEGGARMGLGGLEWPLASEAEAAAKLGTDPAALVANAAEDLLGLGEDEASTLGPKSLVDAGAPGASVPAGAVAPVADARNDLLPMAAEHPNVQTALHALGPPPAPKNSLQAAA